MLFAALLLGACRTNESPEAQVDDLKITAQVRSKLATDLTLTSVTNISVNSTNGVVTLSGQVDSADLKTRAETLAKSVPKVVRVVNSLQVVQKPVSGLSSPSGVPNSTYLRVRSKNSTIISFICRVAAPLTPWDFWG